MSPETIQACQSFPTLASSQTHTQLNLKNKGNQARQGLHTKNYCWTADSTKAIQLCSTNRWDIKAIRCFYCCIPNYCSSQLISLGFQSKWKVGTLKGGANRIVGFKVRPIQVSPFQSRSVQWWSSSRLGAWLSQWTGSCSGWVNEVSRQVSSSDLWVSNSTKPYGWCLPGSAAGLQLAARSTDPKNPKNTFKYCQCHIQINQSNSLSKT